jgi:hypothetical protein
MLDMPSDRAAKPSYPVNVNVRLTIEQHAAIESIAAANDISTSEAARLLLEHGYAELKQRMMNELVQAGERDDVARLQQQQGAA